MKEMKPNSIAILSSLPPPFGGVTVHVERLTAILRQRGIAHTVYEQQGKSLPEHNVVPVRRSAWGTLVFLLTVPESIIHLHTSSVAAISVSLAVLSMRGKRVIVTLHSEKPMRVYHAMRFPMLGLVRFCFRRAAHIIAVSNRIATWVHEMEVNEERITVCPAFLPPSPEQLDPIHLPNEAKRFLESHSPIIGTQGWFGYFVDGENVYALEMLLELLETMRKDMTNVGMFTVISGTYDEQHREALFRKRHEMGLEEHWLILEKSFPAVALYKQCGLFIRPTITDGDAVSIRECLALGVPVVASDAVDRPPGCVLFTNRDRLSLIAQVRSVLVDGANTAEANETGRVMDTVTPVLDAYARVMREVKHPDEEDQNHQ